MMLRVRPANFIHFQTLCFRCSGIILFSCRHHPEIDNPPASFGQRAIQGALGIELITEVDHLFLLKQHR